MLNSLLLEEIARMALLTRQIAPGVAPLKASLIRKHFERKHGPSATYGQPSTEGTRP
jgi:L-ribulose-5-phosphate 4-epimerase